MPYKKRYRKLSKSTRYMNTAQKALATGTTALALARQIKGLVNVEHHRHIISSSSTSITNTGSVLPLHGISQGDNKADRTGNSIMTKYISGKLLFTHNSASPSSSVIRLIYFIDTQQIGDSIPFVTDVLESASTTAPLNRNTIGRFRILKQEYIIMHPNSTEAVVKKIYTKTGSHHVRYNGANATDIQKGGIFRLVISNHVANYPTYQGDEILMFIDN